MVRHSYLPAIGFLLLSSASLGAQDVYSNAASDSSESTNDEPIRTADERTVTGEQVCLPAIPDDDGRVQLDCTIGLRGDDDNFYGLRLADLSKRGALPVVNQRVRVTGYFIPGSDGRYEVVGDIVYTSKKPIDEPRVIRGTLLCIDRDDPSEAQPAQCRRVVRTQRGRLWGLDASSFEKLAKPSSLMPGTTLEIAGMPMSPMPEDWHPWAWRWAPRHIEGVLEVTRVEAVP